MFGGAIVLSSRRLDIDINRRELTDNQSTQFDFLKDLPNVPVQAESLLLMDLGIQESSVDLGAVSQLVLEDVGATLQIMRLAGREFPLSEERPTRIVDCISAVGLRACHEAMSTQAGTTTCDLRYRGIRKAWMHARIIAKKCNLIAEEMSGIIRPDEAYLVGLCHELESLPFVLGWDRAIQIPGDQILIGLRIAEAWSLPQCVVGYFRDLRQFRTSSRLIEIVYRAHRLVGES